MQTTAHVYLDCIGDYVYTGNIIHRGHSAWVPLWLYTSCYVCDDCMQWVHRSMLHLCEVLLFAVSHPIRHSLPTQVLQPLFGSRATGRCTSITGNVCSGTSVLSDGIIPALSGISNCPQSEWADQLFTMKSRDARIVLSFEVEPVNHDRLELVVFNCPEYDI